MIEEDIKMLKDQLEDLEKEKDQIEDKIRLIQMDLEELERRKENNG